ncbi:MAG: hypothetical protein ACUZ8H_14065 [Candidatus Anammoxibacter sp.]
MYQVLDQKCSKCGESDYEIFHTKNLLEDITGIRCKVCGHEKKTVVAMPTTSNNSGIAWVMAKENDNVF